MTHRKIRMNLLPHLAALFLAALLSGLLIARPASASEGHDHDHGEAAPAAGQALPRFAAVSDVFELVGVLDGRQLTLYLDRFADNSPVRGAQIELDIGGTTYKAEPHAGDEYEVLLPDAPPEGVLPITATVTAGSEVDLLAGELDLHAAAHADDATPAPGLLRWAPWGAAGLAVLALLAWRARARRLPAGGAA